jgi:hypothetical protein
MPNVRRGLKGKDIGANVCIVLFVLLIRIIVMRFVLAPFLGYPTLAEIARRKFIKVEPTTTMLVGCTCLRLAS